MCTLWRGFLSAIQHIFVVMFRYASVSVLLLCFAVQTLWGPLLVLDYLTNTQSFANSCENKFKPQLHCNGHCVLARKLKEQHPNDQQNSERKQGWTIYSASCASLYTGVPPRTCVLLKKHIFLRNTLTLIGHARVPFRPPDRNA